MSCQRTHRSLESAAVVRAHEHTAIGERQHDQRSVVGHDDRWIHIAAVALDLLLAHPRPARSTIPAERQAVGETQEQLVPLGGVDGEPRGTRKAPVGMCR